MQVQAAGLQHLALLSGDATAAAAFCFTPRCKSSLGGALRARRARNRQGWAEPAGGDSKAARRRQSMLGPGATVGSRTATRKSQLWPKHDSAETSWALDTFWVSFGEREEARQDWRKMWGDWIQVRKFAKQLLSSILQCVPPAICNTSCLKGKFQIWNILKSADCGIWTFETVRRGIVLGGRMFMNWSIEKM